MKKFLLGSVALAAMFAGPAMAADMPYKAAPPPPVVYYDWSGAYVGFNIGGVWTEVHRNYPGFAATTPGSPSEFTSKGDDAIFGFHAGAQWQWGQWVLGVEAAYSAGANEMRSTLVLPAPPFVANLSASNKITNLFTVGPRLGYAWDRWMIFATGGYAVATIKGQYVVSSTDVAIFPTFSGQSSNHGWYAGGGFEYMIHKGAFVDVILGAEYQHFDVDSKRAFTEVPLVGINDSFDQRARGDLVRARLTIKTPGYGFAWAGK